MNTAVGAKHIVRLNFSQPDGDVVVWPEDQSIFVMRVKEAIQACRVYQDFKEIFQEQLDHLKNVLGQWAYKRRDKVHKVFLTLKDDRMLFLVVQKERKYDRKLEEALTELDLQIAQDSECAQIILDVQSLPRCEEEAYVSFCNPAWILEYQIADA